MHIYIYRLYYHSSNILHIAITPRALVYEHMPVPASFSSFGAPPRVREELLGAIELPFT